MTVMPPTPLSRSAMIRFSGIPQSPKPPLITVMPSKVSPSSADLASEKTLLAMEEHAFRLRVTKGCAAVQHAVPEIQIAPAAEPAAGAFVTAPKRARDENHPEAEVQ